MQMEVQTQRMEAIVGVKLRWAVKTILSQLRLDWKKMETQTWVQRNVLNS